MRKIAMLLAFLPLGALAQGSALAIVGKWKTDDKNWAKAPIQVTADKITLPECPTTTYQILSDSIETDHWVLKGKVRVVVIVFNRENCRSSDNRLSFQIPMEAHGQDFIVVSRYPFVKDGKQMFGASSMYRRAR